mmetsp:Transcript_86/g.151  ORF Transcript_86/g.151 Transcript_86/m.151 type:complete len:444 (+) Transcript_86:77-1408(+)
MHQVLILCSLLFALNRMSNLAPQPELSGGEGLDGSTMIVGLNPALQKRFILDSNLVPGNVHRAQRLEQGIGGKGQDGAVALSCLLDSRDGKSSMSPFLLAQFVGSGSDGDTLMNLLQKQVPFSVQDSYLTVRTRTKLRICTTIVASDSATELVEPSGLVEADEMKQLLNHVNFLASSSSSCGKYSSTLRSFCVMGSMPPGCPIHTYADLAKLAVGQETIILIDAVVGLQPLIEELAKIRTKTAILKVNLSELCHLAMDNTLIKNDKDSPTSCSPEKHVFAVVNSFLRKHKHARDALSHIAITNGKEDSFLVSIKRSKNHDDPSNIFLAEPDVCIWKIPVPRLPENTLFFPIGAGDTVSAALLVSLMHLKGNDPMFCLKEKIRRAINSVVSSYDLSLGGEVACALSFGLSCASASCLQTENSVFDVDDALILFLNMAKPSMLLH